MAMQEADKVIFDEPLGHTAAGKKPDHSKPSRYSREAILIACVILLVLLSVLTAFVTRLYHKKIHTLADQWFAEGEASLQAGNAKEALTDYRNALVYSPDNTVFQFHLAQALAAVGRGDQARSYLLSLLAESPGSGQINLALARIAARAGVVSEAVGDYHRAIFGVWEQDPLLMRWQVQRELCEYLLDRGAVSQAEPELIALADQVPVGDVPRLKTTGALLLRAGMWNRAQSEYRSVLNVNRHDDDALAGAGTAAFELGQYTQAAYYLERLSPEKRADPKLASMLQTAGEIQSANPLQTGISTTEKAKRTENAIRQAQSRAQDCAQSQGESLAETRPATELGKLYATSQQTQNEWSESNLIRYPDRIDTAMSLVFQMEDAAAQACGSPVTGPDHILLLIQRSREGGVQ